MRNDIYLILDRAEFDKGAKSAERNVEIAVTVCDDRGNEVKVRSHSNSHTCLIAITGKVFIPISFLLFKPTMLFT